VPWAWPPQKFIILLPISHPQILPPPKKKQKTKNKKQKTKNKKTKTKKVAVKQNCNPGGKRQAVIII
jgi:hypothetical protein